MCAALFSTPGASLEMLPYRDPQRAHAHHSFHPHRGPTDQSVFGLFRTFRRSIPCRSAPNTIALSGTHEGSPAFTSRVDSCRIDNDLVSLFPRMARTSTTMAAASRSTSLPPKMKGAFTTVPRPPAAFARTAAGARDKRNPRLGGGTHRYRLPPTRPVKRSGVLQTESH